MGNKSSEKEKFYSLILYLKYVNMNSDRISQLDF